MRPLTHFYVFPFIQKYDQIISVSFLYTCFKNLHLIFDIPKSFLAGNVLQYIRLINYIKPCRNVLKLEYLCFSFVYIKLIKDIKKYINSRNIFKSLINFCNGFLMQKKKLLIIFLAVQNCKIDHQHFFFLSDKENIVII